MQLYLYVYIIIFVTYSRVHNNPILNWSVYEMFVLRLDHVYVRENHVYNTYNAVSR